MPYDRSLVLIADDNEDDREMTMRFVRQAVPGVELVTCADGEETLKCLQDYAHGSISDLPDLALLDMKMPKLNGDEVVERLREERTLTRIPVVLFSSSVLEADVERCLRAGVRSYVQKPTDYEEYKQIVRRLCEYWLEVNLDLRASMRA